MIVRVMGDGQYEVGEEVLERLNAIDREATAALEREDEGELRTHLEGMGDIVRSVGRRLSEDTLVASEIVLPASDFTLEETRKLVSEQGLIPDPPV